MKLKLPSVYRITLTELCQPHTSIISGYGGGGVSKENGKAVLLFNAKAATVYFQR